MLLKDLKLGRLQFRRNLLGLSRAHLLYDRRRLFRLALMRRLRRRIRVWGRR